MKKKSAKTLVDLMKDEDGYVSKETILKVGLSTVAALGVVGTLTDIGAHAQVTHTNSVVPSGNCLTHTNMATHNSY